MATDGQPVVASDGLGGWLAAWHSHASNVPPSVGAIGEDADVFAAFRPAGADRWSTVTVVNDGAAADARYDRPWSIETDGAGRWIVAWVTIPVDPLAAQADLHGQDMDLFYALSTDNGDHWTSATALNSTAAGDLAPRGTAAALWMTEARDVRRSSDGDPVIRHSASGTWLCVWDSNTTTTDGRTDLGDDFDILFSRSTDGGTTWSAAAPLNVNAHWDARPAIANPEEWEIDWAQLATGADTLPSIATDHHGAWLATWTSTQPMVGQSAIGSDADVLVARSADDGQTWGRPVVVNSGAATDSPGTIDAKPVVETDGMGNWFIGWIHYVPAGEAGGAAISQIMISQSTDGGATWSTAAPLTDDIEPMNGAYWDLDPIVLDSEGNWAVSWASEAGQASMFADGATVPVTIGDDWDLLYASATAPLAEPPASDGIMFNIPAELTLSATMPASVIVRKLPDGEPQTVSAGSAAITQEWRLGTELLLTAPAQVAGGTLAWWEVDGLRQDAGAALGLTMEDHHAVRIVYDDLKVMALSPLPEARTAGIETTIAATFSQAMHASEPTTPILAQGSIGGRIRGTVARSGATYTLTPAAELERGERVQATLTGSLRASAGAATLGEPAVWQFIARGGDALSSASFVYPVPLGNSTSTVSSVAVANLRRLDRETTPRMLMLLGVEGGPPLLARPEAASVADVVLVPADALVPLDQLTSLADPLPACSARALAIGDLHGTPTLTGAPGLAEIVIGNDAGVNYLCRGGYDPADPAARNYVIEAVYSFGSAEYRTTALALGDLNGDGRSEIIAGNDGQADTITFNDGWGSFSTGCGSVNTTIGELEAVSTGTFGPARTRTQALALGDADLDGDLDIFAAYSGEGVAVLLNDGRGGFAAEFGTTRTVSIAPVARPTSLAAADFNGDGRCDIAVGSQEMGNSVWYNLGLRKWREEPLTDAEGASPRHATRAIVAADLNGDGWLDLAVANSKGEGNLIFFNRQGRGFVQQQLCEGPSTAGARALALAAADVNGDGKLDLLAGNRQGPSTLWLQDVDAVPFRMVDDRHPGFVYDWATSDLAPLLRTVSVGGGAQHLLPVYDDSYYDVSPSLASDGQGHWMMAWASEQPLGYRPQAGNPPLRNFDLGGDFDIILTRCFDGRGSVRNNFDPQQDPWHGLSLDEDTGWTRPVPLLDATGATVFSGDAAIDYSPSLAADGLGNWAVAWASAAEGTIRIMVCTSTDDGVTWSAPVQVGESLDQVADRTARDTAWLPSPRLVCDRQAPASHWMVFWSGMRPADPEPRDWDIYVTRASCLPAGEGSIWGEWSPAAAVNSNASWDTGHDGNSGSFGEDWRGIDAATDGAGNWVVAWHSNDRQAAELWPPGFADWDILFTVSTDNGRTWRKPGILNTYAGVDRAFPPYPENDRRPRIVWNGRDGWIAWWLSNVYTQSLVDSGVPIDGGTSDDDYFMARLPLERVLSGEGYDPTDGWTGSPWTLARAFLPDAKELMAQGELGGGQCGVEIARAADGALVALYASAAHQAESETDNSPYDAWHTVSTDYGDSWTSPTRLNLPLAFHFCDSNGPEFIHTPVVEGDAKGTIMLALAYQYEGGLGSDYDIVNARTPGAWGDDWPAYKFPSYHQGAPPPARQYRITPECTEALRPASIRRVPEFPFEALESGYGYVVAAASDLLTTTDLREWQVALQPGDAATAAHASVAYFHAPVLQGEIASISDLGRVEFTANARRVGGDANFSLWVFKGGVHSGADWNRPDAWERLGAASEWPRLVDAATTLSAALGANFIRYVSAAEDGDGAGRFGNIDGEGGQRRPAGTLTWAVVADRLDNVTHPLAFDLARVALWRVEGPRRTLPADALDLPALERGRVRFSAAPGAFAGAAHLDLVTTPAGITAHLDFSVAIEQPEDGMAIRVRGYAAKGDPLPDPSLELFSLTAPFGAGATWTANQGKAYRTELPNPLLLEQMLLEGKVYLEVRTAAGVLLGRGWFGADWDEDGLHDAEEQALGADPRDRDTDDDGVLDGEEVRLGMDPAAPESETAAGDWRDQLSDGRELGLSESSLAARGTSTVTKTVIYSDSATTSALIRATATGAGATNPATGLQLIDADTLPDPPGGE